MTQSAEIRAGASHDSVLDFDITVQRPGFVLHAAASFGPGVTAVFGPSGAGKSTLLGAIAGSVTPSRGHIALRGRHLYSSASKTALPPERRRVGFVYQDAALFPHMTVRENIAYGYHLTRKETRRVEPSDLSGLLGISHLLDRRPTDLSGGEKQRVALARTLATSPELLLLDEPMSALDIRLRGIVLGYLKVVHRELQMPMVYVSHSISEVLVVASMALILEEGRVRAFDTPRRLLSQVSASDDDDGESHGVDNILEGQVIEAHSDGAAGVVSVGGAKLVAPSGHRQFGERVVLAIGAREIIIAIDKPSGISARNVLAGKVVSIDGTRQRQIVTVDCGARLMAEVTSAATSELGLGPGKDVYLVIKTSSIAVMDAFQLYP